MILFPPQCPSGLLLFPAFITSSVVCTHQSLSVRAPTTLLTWNTHAHMSSIYTLSLLLTHTAHRTHTNTHTHTAIRSHLRSITGSSSVYTRSALNRESGRFRYYSDTHCKAHASANHVFPLESSVLLLVWFYLMFSLMNVRSN